MSPNPVNYCKFCGREEVDEINYGEFLKKDGIAVHYFCMLFSSALPQRGKDEKGILGFLIKDIEKELRRGKRLKCSYCQKLGATIGCELSSCSKRFHLPCGRKHGTLHQFCGKFSSYCKNHKPRQKSFPTVEKARSSCSICLDEISTWNESLACPSCKNSKFHFHCLQKHALSAGKAHFSCPICKDFKKFQRELLTYGIYIPQKDANWELEPNAFQELYERPQKCHHPKCRCPEGRQYVDEGKWNVIWCKNCGAQGCHVSCDNISVYKPSWECSECLEILNPRVKKTFCAPKRKKKQVDQSTRVLRCATNRLKLQMKPCSVVLRRLDEHQENKKTEKKTGDVLHHTEQLVDVVNDNPEAIKSAKPRRKYRKGTPALTPEFIYFSSDDSDDLSSSWNVCKVRNGNETAKKVKTSVTFTSKSVPSSPVKSVPAPDGNKDSHIPVITISDSSSDTDYETNSVSNVLQNSVNNIEVNFQHSSFAAKQNKSLLKMRHREFFMPENNPFHTGSQFVNHSEGRKARKSHKSMTALKKMELKYMKKITKCCCMMKTNDEKKSDLSVNRNRDKLKESTRKELCLRWIQRHFDSDADNSCAGKSGSTSGSVIVIEDEMMTHKRHRNDKKITTRRKSCKCFSCKIRKTKCKWKKECWNNCCVCHNLKECFGVLKIDK